MKMVPLGELAKEPAQYGIGLSSRVWHAGDPRYIRITDIREDGSLNPALVAPDGETSEWEKARLGEDDLLFARSGATVGKTYIHPKDARLSVYAGYLIRFRIDQNRALPRYVFHYTQSPAYRSWVASSQRAVAQPNINAKQYATLPVPLPSLAEQRRIADILDHADAVRAKRRGVLQHQRDLPQAVFRDMFSRWNGLCATIAEVAMPEKGSIRTGPFGSQLLHSEFVDQGIAVLGLDNVVSNEFTWGQRRYITAEKYETLRRYTVRPADVLMSIMGTCGRCVVVPSDIETAINTKHICAITVDPRKALPDFVRGAFLWHPMSRRFLTRMTKGSIMDGLNMGIIKATPIPLPDLDAQQEFVDRVEVIDKCTRVSADLQTKSEELFASIQMRAFRGDL